jgi:hypothetical protein
MRPFENLLSVWLWPSRENFRLGSILRRMQRKLSLTAGGSPAFSMVVLLALVAGQVSAGHRLANASAESAPSAAKGAGQAILVVLNKSDHEAALVDPDSYQVLVKLPTGKGPHEVAASADGHSAYVSNYGSFGVFRPGEPAKVEPGHTITVLDLQHRSVRTTFDLGSFTRPHGIWVSRDSKRVWVTCEGAQAVLEGWCRPGASLTEWTGGIPDTADRMASAW